MYWEYDTRLGRRWNLDPVDQVSISNYAVNRNNPIAYIDPKGDFNTKFGAWLYKIAHGGDEIRKDRKSGEWFVGTEVKYKGKGLGAAYKKRFDWKGRNKPVNDHTDPWHLGIEWLTGIGPREHHFVDRDPMTEMLKQHKHIEQTKEIVRNNINNIKIDEPKQNPYDLKGVGGVPKYFGDYSTLLTFGATGNLAVTYLGSYSLTYTITEINLEKGTATIHFKVTNASTISSATHPPVIGYTEMWNNNIGKPLDKAFEDGPMSKTIQTFEWDETINLNGTKK